MVGYYRRLQMVLLVSDLRPLLTYNYVGQVPVLLLLLCLLVPMRRWIRPFRRLLTLSCRM